MACDDDTLDMELLTEPQLRMLAEASILQLTRIDEDMSRYGVESSSGTLAHLRRVMGQRDGN